MKGSWKLRLRLWAVSFLMFVIVFALVSFAFAISGYSPGLWLYFLISIGIILLQYLIGPSLIKTTMKVEPVTPEEQPRIHAMVEEMSKKQVYLNRKLEYLILIFQMHLHMEELKEVVILH